MAGDGDDNLSRALYIFPCVHGTRIIYLGLFFLHMNFACPLNLFVTVSLVESIPAILLGLWLHVLEFNVFTPSYHRSVCGIIVSAAAAATIDDCCKRVNRARLGPQLFPVAI